MRSDNYKTVTLEYNLLGGVANAIFNLGGVKIDKYQKFINAESDFSQKYPYMLCKKILSLDEKIYFLVKGSERKLGEACNYLLQYLGKPNAAFGPVGIIDDIFDESDFKSVGDWWRNLVGIKRIEFLKQFNYQ